MVEKLKLYYNDMKGSFHLNERLILENKSLQKPFCCFSQSFFLNSYTLKRYPCFYKALFYMCGSS